MILYGKSHEQLADHLLGNAVRKCEELTSNSKTNFYSHKTTHKVSDFLINRCNYRETLTGIKKLKDRVIEKRNEKGNVCTFIFRWILYSYYIRRISKVQANLKTYQKEPTLPEIAIYKTARDYMFLLQNRGFTSYKKYGELAQYLSALAGQFEITIEGERQQQKAIDTYIIAYLKEKQPNAELEIDRLKWQTPLITAKDVEGVIAWTPTPPKSQHRDVLTATLSTASKVAEVSGSVAMGILKTAFWLITPGF